MNAKLAASVLGAAILGAVAWGVARAIRDLAPAAMWLTIVGLIVGFVITPFVLAAHLRRLDEYLRTAPIEDLFVALFGLGVGLVIAALLTVPLVIIGSPVGNFLPTVFAIVIALVCMRIALLRRSDVHGMLAARSAATVAAVPATSAGSAPASSNGNGNAVGTGSDAGNGHRPQVLLDTSVIIDGRIADISTTGFISGDIVVPRFILDELRHIADSPDVLRRTRGRRGLDMLQRMSKETDGQVTILDIDPRDVRDVPEVDGKLVQVARKLHAPIITTDFNLNKVAQLQGVRVLNINELANAVKPVVLPNEEMTVKIIQPGKEHGQGVGYLDDGTMIVVEDGARYIDQEVDIVITRNLQTVAGRMIFATLKGQAPRGPYSGMRGR